MGGREGPARWGSNLISQDDGDGLGSQEYRCSAYAAAHGLEVEAVFSDKRAGGGDFMNRPGMVGLLEYLDAHPENAYVVIFDDLKRFARDTMFHLMLRQELAAYGATVACLNFKFEDKCATPAASPAQHRTCDGRSLPLGMTMIAAVKFLGC